MKTLKTILKALFEVLLQLIAIIIAVLMATGFLYLCVTWPSVMLTVLLVSGISMYVLLRLAEEEDKSGDVK